MARKKKVDTAEADDLITESLSEKYIGKSSKETVEVLKKEFPKFEIQRIGYMVRIKARPESSERICIWDDKSENVSRIYVG